MYFLQIVSVSNEIRNILVTKYYFTDTKVTVIYNGIPKYTHNKVVNNTNNTEFNIGTVGRLVPVKDIELFLNVAKELIKNNQGIRFKILGDGPLRNKLINISKQLNLENKMWTKTIVSKDFGESLKALKEKKDPTFIGK